MTAVVWYLCIVVFWAAKPMNDAVPVGIDFSLSTPAFVSVPVQCQGVFDSASRDNSPLPTLNVQPIGKPKLVFNREPCVIVHHQARIVFAVDTALFAVVVLTFGWLTLRWRRSSSSARSRSDTSFVGLSAG